MTAAMISPYNRQALLALSYSAKADIVAIVANKLSIISGNAQLINANDKTPANIRHHARVIDRASEILLQELRQALGME